MQCKLLLLLSIAITASVATQALGDQFTDGHLTVEWSINQNAVTGTLKLGAQSFPVTAEQNGSEIDGTFQANGSAFGFTSSVAGDVLTLTTGGKTYTLKSTAAAANPLGTAPANPLAGGDKTGGADAPAGYAVVTHTDAGQAWSITKKNATNVRGALVDTLGDLDHYFGDKVKSGGAYEDTQSHQTGGAAFTAIHNGEPVRGMISVTMQDHAAIVAVVYAKTGVTADQWKKLTNPAPPAQAGAVPAVNLTQYNFPDGSGSIGVAPDWTTSATTETNMFQIKGPNDALVTMGLTLVVYDPNAMMVQMRRQNEQRALQMGMRPIQGPPMLIAPFCRPAEALQRVVPQLSALSQQNGGTAMTLDQIVNSKTIQSNLPNGKAAVLEYLITKDDHGQKTHHHAMARIECSPIGNGVWMIFANEIGSQSSDFAKFKPTMLAMVSSLKENTEVIQRIVQERQQNQQQQFQNAQNASQRQQAQFAAQQQSHRQQMASYDAHNRAWAKQENIKARSSDNFVEAIRGYRTVYDTQTGEKSSADYLNVNGIVNGLNANNPGRYVQIPLRDENDPVPQNP